jgi:hypothetical protein
MRRRIEILANGARIVTGSGMKRVYRADDEEVLSRSMRFRAVHEAEIVEEKDLDVIRVEEE